MGTFEQARQKISSSAALRRWSTPLTFTALVLTLGSSACKRAPAPEETQSTTTTTTATDTGASSTLDGPLAPANTLRFVEPPDTGDVATIVKSELDRAKGEGRRVLVYVGATWCEPCQRFHQAAERGELDADLGNLTFVQFDLDRDRDRLSEAGYVSEYIPLFALPNRDGTMSSHSMAGSIKGSGAVRQIVPRMQQLLQTKL